MSAPREVVELDLTPPDNARLANLCGAMDDNLGRLSRALAVDIRRRGARFRLSGAGGAPRVAADALRALYARAEREEIAPHDVQMCVAENWNGKSSAAVNSGSDLNFAPVESGEESGEGESDADESKPRRASRPPRGPREFSARTAGQREYLEKIRAHDLTICAGPAGAGKTYLAVAAALESGRRGETERLILTRPAVEAGGEKLGFLPGDMEQKVNPYLRPLHDSLHRLLGRAESERRMMKSGRGSIEIIPLAFMRGLTLEGAFVILDEAQNTAPEQMKMLLTRLGPGSKIVVTGDDTQNDLPPGSESGLADAMRRLRGLPGVAVHRFSMADIVRHPLTRSVILAYENEPK